MHCFIKRFGSTLAIMTGLVLPSQAYVLIDDFTVGTFTSVLTGNQGHLEVSPGLDRSHSAFGWRQSSTQLLGNTNGATLTVSIGNGEQRFQADKLAKWDHSLVLGNNTSIVDFSSQAEFWVDYHTENPANSFADHWGLVVSDIDGHSAAGGIPLSRSGGIYFLKSSFVGTVDWARISYIEFTQNWNAAPNPLVYTVTSFYAVPEPELFFLTLPLFIAVRRQATRKLAAK